MSDPDMSDPELLAWRCAEAMLAEDEASRAAGVTIDDVGPGRAAVRMRVGEAMINGHSLCHDPGCYGVGIPTRLARPTRAFSR